MYCKNCGAQLPESAKFCTSCGSKIEAIVEPKQEPVQDEYQDYFDEPVQEESKKDFNYNQGLQEGATYTDRPTNVYGKKFSAGTSGSIAFGDPNKKPSFFKKLIVGGFVIVTLIIAYYALFGDSGPVYDVQLGVEVNSETLYPDEPLTEFITSEGLLYISYSTIDMPIGDSMVVEIYDMTFGEFLIDYVNVSIDFEEQYGYVYLDHNWTVGDYEVRFVYNGEVVNSTSFEVFVE